MSIAIEPQLNLFDVTHERAPVESVSSRSDKLYRWTVQVAQRQGKSQLQLVGFNAPGSDVDEVQSHSIVSLEVASLRAVDVKSRRYRLLSPRSLDAVSELKVAVVQCGVQVTWHGWPYHWGKYIGPESRSLI